MPSSHQIDHKAKIIFTSWNGDVTDEECIDALINYETNIKSDQSLSGYNEIVDFSSAATIDLTFNGMVSLIKIAGKTELVSPDNKLALIMTSFIGRSSARLYKKIRAVFSKNHKEIGVFESREDAISWINPV